MTTAKRTQSEPTKSTGSDLPLLDAPEHVLSTLESDGSRRWILSAVGHRPLWKRRRTLGYSLIVFFVVVPHLRIDGKPLVLLDIPARKFVFLGHTFLPTDTLLLALVMLSVFRHHRVGDGVRGPRVVRLGVSADGLHGVPVSADRSALRGNQRERAASRNARLTGVLAVAALGASTCLLCIVLAHTFLAYFVGTDQLAKWIVEFAARASRRLSW